MSAGAELTRVSCSPSGGPPMDNLPFEPERYELYSGPAYSFRLGRRDFFRGLGGGLVIALAFKNALGQESGSGRRRGSGESMPKTLAAWMHIGEDGLITVYTGKVEV